MIEMTDNKEREVELDFNMIEDWVLDDWFRLTDFMLTDWDSLPTLFEQDDEIYEYNQNANLRSKKSCTIYSAMGAVSDLFNYKFSLEEIKEIDDLSYQYGRREWQWWYTYKAVDLVRKRWNSKPELVKQYGKVAYYRVDLANDSLVNTILTKGYTLCSWYHGNYEYGTDFMKDWVLNLSKLSSNTYNHAVSWRMIDGNRCIKDNYKWRQFNWEDRNIYRVEPKCSELVSNWVYFPNAYLFTKVAEDNYDELIRLNKMKNLLFTALDCHSQLRHLTNDNTYKEFLHKINETHRNKVKDCDREIDLHS